MPKFDVFRSALEALCRNHDVYLGSTETGEVGIWDLSPGDEPLTAAIVDRTIGDAPAQRFKDLPNHFETLT